MQIDNHLTEEQVAQCADDIVDGRYEALNSELRQHLAICDECAAEVLSVSDIVVDSKRLLNTSRKLTFRPWIIAITSAAAVGLLFFIIGSTLYKKQNSLTDIIASTNTLDTARMESQTSLREDQSMDKETVRTTDKRVSANAMLSEQKPTKVVQKDILADAYIPNKTLETLSENFTQAYRSEDIVVNSTGITSNLESDSLKWNNPLGAKLFVEFFNNKDERILTLTDTSSGIPIPELEKGLFYWKLINQDFDLLFVGKILIE